MLPPAAFISINLGREGKGSQYLFVNQVGSWKIFLLEIKQQSQRKDKKACYSSNDQGGLRDIKAVLFQYRGRLSSLRAGESFLTRLAKEDSMSMVRALS